MTQASIDGLLTDISGCYTITPGTLALACQHLADVVIAARYAPAAADYPLVRAALRTAISDEIAPLILDNPTVASLLDDGIFHANELIVAAKIAGVIR